ncbi:LapD/MoxY N-terminal periplasmic domain-containing protein [Roseovarius sp.]|uniref:sensor histidine kinase n=1 Tax=Roseovarius sp. TaxID=1486281 RepID=UPI003B590A47
MSVLSNSVPANVPDVGFGLKRISILHLVAVVSALGGFLLCAAVATVVVVNARLAVEREVSAAFDLARQTISMRMPTSFDGNDTLGEAVRLAKEVDAQRHVSVELLDTKGNRIQIRASGAERSPEAPAWFEVLLSHDVRREVYSVTSYPNVLGTLNLLSDPTDEIGEVWEDFRLILPMIVLMGAAMAMMSILLTRFVVRRMDQIKQALVEMQGGALHVRAPEDGPLELADLSKRVNALARHLDLEQGENRMLHARLLSLSETERARIASDLHDEMGPLLFALGAAADQARQEAERASPGRNEVLIESVEAIQGYIRAVKRSAREAINELRPMLAGEATLAELLEDLASQFSDVMACATIEVEAGTQVSVEPVEEIAIYRFARESMLNALRHASPDRVVISLQDHGAEIRVRVADNGQKGAPETGHPKMGQIGMADRARAIGAEYVSPWRADGWTITEMRILRS